MRPPLASKLVFSLLSAAVVCGCGDDDPDGPRARDAGAEDAGPAAGAGGRAGRGGSPAAGSGGRGAAGSEGAAGGSAPVQCGDVTCEAPPDSFAVPCCADEETSACGFSVLGRCSRPAKADPDCPSLDFAGILAFPSCCNARNMCGIDVSSVGGPSCLDLASAAERARMSGATAVFPPPRSCDSNGEKPDAIDDAGASDAGVSDDAGS